MPQITHSKRASPITSRGEAGHLSMPRNRTFTKYFCLRRIPPFSATTFSQTKSAVAEIFPTTPLEDVYYARRERVFIERQGDAKVEPRPIEHARQPAFRALYHVITMYTYFPPAFPLPETHAMQLKPSTGSATYLSTRDRSKRRAMSTKPHP